LPEGQHGDRACRRDEFFATYPISSVTIRVHQWLNLLRNFRKLPQAGSWPGRPRSTIRPTSRWFSAPRPR
jgi:hypothetical protein